MRRVANLPQCGGIDQIDIPINEHSEGGLVTFGVVLQQRDVVVIRHLLIMFTEPEL